jgi:DNA replication protein DnaC
VRRDLAGAVPGVRRTGARACPVLLDELGFVPSDRTGGELLFSLLAARYKKRATLVTTNLACSEWPAVCGGDEKLTTALIDRLADRATIITTRGRSFRLGRRRARDEPLAAGPEDTVLPEA